MQCIPIIVRLPLQLLRVNHCLFSAIWVIEVLTRLNVIAGAASRGGFTPIQRFWWKCADQTQREIYTLFQTKIRDFQYSISDLKEKLIPCLRPLSKLSRRLQHITADN